MHCNARVSVFNKLQWLQWPACSAGQKVEERQAICSAEQEEQEQEQEADNLLRALALERPNLITQLTAQYYLQWGTSQMYLAGIEPKMHIAFLHAPIKALH